MASQSIERGGLVPTDRAEISADSIRKALKEQGYVFFLRIQPKSIGQLVNENPDDFGDVDLTDGQMSLVPEEAEVAVNPGRLFLPRSFNIPQGTQRSMIEEHGNGLKVIGPALAGVTFEMSHASVYVQLALAYQEVAGKQLFAPNCFAHTVDENVYGHVFFANSFAYVGRQRGRSPDRLSITNWFNFILDGYPFLIGAMPVAVLPQKLSV